MRPDVFPTRFRRRLTAAFVLVAGAASGALAGGTFVFVRANRIERFEDRSVRQAVLNLELAPLRLPATEVDELLELYQRRGGFEAVAITDGAVLSSEPPLGTSAVLDRLEPAPSTGEVGVQPLAVEGVDFLVVAGRIADSSTELYFFFSRVELLAGLRELRNVLLVGWAIVVVVAAAAGSLVARRTLSPVRVASNAAHSLAEGVLDTRLEVGRLDEFGTWARDFNEMAAALQAKIVALSEARERERRFTADVAHELRTPLGSIVAAGSILEERSQELDPDMRRAVELLGAELRRLRVLVEDLLELARLEAGHAEPDQDIIELTGMVRRVAERSSGPERITVDGPELQITTNRRRLERVVVNLVGNALRYTPGPVSVSVRKEGTDAVVEVSDEGPGIAPEHLPHLFERFYKVDRSRTAGGSGLGLAIVWQNVRVLGGSIEVQSSPDRGSRFRIQLPRTEPLPGGDVDVTRVMDTGS